MSNLENRDRPEHDRVFEIKIDRTTYKVREQSLTGSQLRALPNPDIGADRDLFEVVPGGSDRKIEPSDRVDMRNGLRFFTAPAQINPGALGEAGMLPSSDQEFLQGYAPEAAVSVDGGMICVVIPSFPLPKGFTALNADLLLRLSPGYPDVPPDMWWFSPDVRRSAGGVIPATELQESYLGRSWQRWSRHFSPGQWRSGVDSLQSYLALVRSELAAAATLRAA